MHFTPSCPGFDFLFWCYDEIPNYMFPNSMMIKLNQVSEKRKLFATGINHSSLGHKAAVLTYEPRPCKCNTLAALVLVVKLVNLFLCKQLHLPKREPSKEYSPSGPFGPDLVSLVPCLGDALGVVGVLKKSF